MKRPVRFVSAMAAMALVPSAHALQFDFTIFFSSGPLSGQSSVGQLETTGGDGSKSPSDGSLIRLAVTIDGEVFTEAAESSYPMFPIAEISGSETTISSLEYISAALPSGATLSIHWSANLGVNEVAFSDASSAVSEGLVRTAPSVVVLSDSPTTGFLLAAGTAGLALARRRLARR